MRYIALAAMAALLIGCESGLARNERMAAEMCERQGVSRASPQWPVCFGTVFAGLNAGS